MTSIKDLAIFRLKKEELETAVKKLTETNQERQREIDLRIDWIRKNEVQIMLHRVALRFIDDSIKGLKVNTLEEPVECLQEE